MPFEAVWIWFAQPWVTALAMLASIVAFPTAVILYLRSRKVRSLSCSRSSLAIASAPPPGFGEFQLTYEGRTVQDVIVTQILVWNDGTETISEREVSEADPLRVVVLEGTEVLACSMIEQTRRAVGARVDRSSVDPNQSLVHFEFLDPSDGFVIQVMHTGGSRKSPALLGTIQGVRSISDAEPWRSSPWTLQDAFLSSLGACVLTLVVALVVAGARAVIGLARSETLVPDSFRLPLAVVATLGAIALIAVWLNFARTKLFPKPGHPALRLKHGMPFGWAPWMHPGGFVPTHPPSIGPSHEDE